MPQVTILKADGRKAGSVDLAESLFGAPINESLIHQAVIRQLAGRRLGTSETLTRGRVNGGGKKPWRQKGTGRARQGTTRAPHWTGGGLAFPPGMRNFEVKVNRKARRAALCGALSNHVANGTFALLDGSYFETLSTARAAALLDGWDTTRPTLVVATEDEEVLVKSFRNLEKVLVTVPAELEVAAVVWARSVLVSEAALPLVLARAGAGPEEETAE